MNICKDFYPQLCYFFFDEMTRGGGYHKSMGIFGEKYSKENYENAEQAVKEFEIQTNSKKSSRAEKIAKEGGLEFWSYIEFSNMQRMDKEVKERLGELLKKGHGEALKLNQEYDRLLDNVKRAVNELAEFKREKLSGVEKTDNKESE